MENNNDIIDLDYWLDNVIIASESIHYHIDLDQLLHLLQETENNDHGGGEIRDFSPMLIENNDYGGEVLDFSAMLMEHDDYVEQENFSESLELLLTTSFNDYFPTATPATQESVEKLKKVEIEEKDMNCSICLEEMLIGSEGKELPCMHVFHQDCIMEWLKNNHTCPLCRYQMPIDSSSSILQ